MERKERRGEKGQPEREAQSLQIRAGGIQRPRVPCADLTPLALCQSDSVGLHGHAEVIINDVITESGGMRPF